MEDLSKTSFCARSLFWGKGKRPVSFLVRRPNNSGEDLLIAFWIFVCLEISKGFVCALALIYAFYSWKVFSWVFFLISGFTTGKVRVSLLALVARPFLDWDNRSTSFTVCSIRSFEIVFLSTTGFFCLDNYVDKSFTLLIPPVPVCSFVFCNLVTSLLISGVLNLRYSCPILGFV